MTVSCEKVGLDYFDHAPFRFPLRQEIDITPDQLFDVFLDAESWPQWVFAIKKVEWTSPFPLEVGATRTVTMPGGMIAYEEFIAWEPGRHMAFRFNELSKGGVSAFGEDYRITDLGDGRCRLDWTMAMTPAGASRYTMPLLRPLFPVFLKRTLKQLARYCDRLPATAVPSTAESSG